MPFLRKTVTGLTHCIPHCLTCQGFDPRHVAMAGSRNSTNSQRCFWNFCQEQSRANLCIREIGTIRCRHMSPSAMAWLSHSLRPLSWSSKTMVSGGMCTLDTAFTLGQSCRIRRRCISSSKWGSRTSLFHALGAVLYNGRAAFCTTPFGRQCLTLWKTYLFMYLFIHSFIRSFIHSFIHSCIHSFIHTRTGMVGCTHHHHHHPFIPSTGNLHEAQLIGDERWHCCHSGPKAVLPMK